MGLTKYIYNALAVLIKFAPVRTWSAPLFFFDNRHEAQVLVPGADSAHDKSNCS